MSWKHFDEEITMTAGEKRRKLEEEKGIIIRFVIGHRCALIFYKQTAIFLH
jgi:hypothetical protein